MCHCSLHSTLYLHTLCIVCTLDYIIKYLPSACPTKSDLHSMGFIVFLMIYPLTHHKRDWLPCKYVNVFMNRIFNNFGSNIKFIDVIMRFFLSFFFDEILECCVLCFRDGFSAVNSLWFSILKCFSFSFVFRVQGSS